MMRQLYIASSLVVLLCGSWASPCLAWDVSEHRFLGDTVYDLLQRLDPTLLDPSLLRSPIVIQGGASEDSPPINRSFGQLCAGFAGDDLAHNRFHDRGKTVLEQLQTLDSQEIAKAISVAIENSQGSSRGQSFPPRIPATNAIAAYLLHHLMALRVVGQPRSVAVEPREQLRHSLVLESIAQGYLADAFSAGHLLVPLDDPLSSLHPRNNREVHNSFCTQGVYVINGRGDVWQTFGDRVLRWYPQSVVAVVEACKYSLAEVLVTYHVFAGDPMPEGLEQWISSVAPGARANELVSAWLIDRDGAEYYDSLHMPTLMLLPMPVAASWSIRTEATDEHGIRRRHHYPQLRDDGLHDPDAEGIDEEFLFSRTSVPDWMIPEQLSGASPTAPTELTRSDPNWASVRWLQHRSVAPSFKGALLHLGGQLPLNGDSRRVVESIGIGYGFWDDLILAKNVSANLSVQGVLREDDPIVVILSAGGGLAFSIIPLVKALHLEGGPAIVDHSGETKLRGMTGIGLDSRVFPLGFTQAGITVRVKYVSLLGGPTMRGLGLELILQ